MSILPNNNDVLFGKGKIALNHPGNDQFRTIVESWKKKYSNAKPADKRKIALEIIKIIESLDPPGRFLIEVSNESSGACSGSWVQVNREKAIKKVCHRLREKKKESRKSRTIDESRKSANDEGIDEHAIKSGEISGGNDELARVVDAASLMNNSLVSSANKNQFWSCRIKNSPRNGNMPILSEAGANLESEIYCEINTAALHLEQGALYFNENDSTNGDSSVTPSEFLEVGYNISKISASPGLPAAALEISKTVKLNEWIAHTVKAVGISTFANSSHYSSYGDDIASWPAEAKTSIASSSEYYILHALKIGLSLADQICNWDEFRQNNSNGHDGFMSQPGKDWSSRTVVHVLHETMNNAVFDLEPLPLSSANETLLRSNDSASILQSITQSQQLLNRDSSEEQDKYQLLKPYKAQILPPTENERWNTNGNLKKIHLHIIYNLGEVFYELFSGGNKLREDEEYEAYERNTRRDRFEPAVDFSGQLKISHIGSSRGDAIHFGNKKGRSSDTESDGCHGTAIESLKLHGVPIAICKLIGNMLDCKNGDIIADDSYHHIADVRSDLQLMIKKPDKFLWDLDAEKLCKTGLELTVNALYGRKKELESLSDWYQRPSSQNDEFAIISGPSGIGKTALANQFEKFVTDSGGIFISGKFDQLKQSAPFPTIACAFNEYCNFLVGDVGSRESVDIASALREVFGRDACYLARMIPNLSMIFGGFDDCDDANDCVNAEKRLQYLLCRFVKVISSFSAHPIVLFLDDLQWADQASINLLSQLLLESRFSRFLIAGACRDNEMRHDHPIWNMVSAVQHLGVKAMNMKISLLDKMTMNAMVSDVLCLPPRVTRPLSDIVHHKTKGNPLFYSRLMISLNKEGLLQFNLSRRRWVWDEENIQSRKIPDDVAKLLTSAISQLPSDVQAALCALSCFGASLDVSIVEILEQYLDLRLKSSLGVAATEGFLDLIKERYIFSHDRVQEAAYNMMSTKERALRHSQYGVAIYSYAIDSGRTDELLFTAIDQINRGGPTFISDSEQRALMSNLNLQAGKKAMDMSDFSSALTFFEYGVSFFEENLWQNNYDLTLALFDNAAKCAYAIGDHGKVNSLSEKVLTSARSFGDELNIMYFTVSALCDASLLDEAIQKSVWVLSMLGEELHPASSREKMLVLIQETRSTLRDRVDDELMRYKPMEDSSKIMAMKFLSRLVITLVMARPADIPLVTLKMVQLSLAHGMSPMSAVGFVYFGSILASIGHIEEGCRFVKLAKNLVQRFGCREVAGEVIAIATQTIGFVDPIHTTLDSHMEGYKMALEAGDTRSASINFFFYCNYLLWSGSKSLSFTKNKFEEVCRFMKQHNVVAILLIAGTRTMDKLIDGNVSQNEPPSNIPTEEFLKEKNPYAAKMLHFQNMFIHFMFRDYDAMEYSAKKYFDYKLDTWTSFFMFATQTFVCGLVSFWMHRRTSDESWLCTGIRLKAVLEGWSESSTWNFLHKFHLLEAEENFCTGRYSNAKLSYDNAIFLSKEHKFINDEALACELAGYFAYETGDESAAVGYLTRAHENYNRWGAAAKSMSIYDFIQSMLQKSTKLDENAVFSSMPSGLRHATNIDNTGTSSQNARKRDLPPNDEMY